ncbi:MAG TPA: hypothetical protein PL105_24670, partial [Caldilineaceae bacterium]|nr:hypothetical protein [Caldilineaceae bacterium]
SGLQLPQQALSVPVAFDVASLDLPSLGGLSVPVDFAVSGLQLPQQALSVPVAFDVPEIVLPPMSQEVALNFASGRSSGFDLLGNVFSSRQMTAALQQAGQLAARAAESGAAQLATLRSGIGQQAGWLADLLPGLRSEQGEERENAAQRLEWVLGQLRDSVSFDFAPGALLPDGLRDWEGADGDGEGCVVGLGEAADVEDGRGIGHGGRVRRPCGCEHRKAERRRATRFLGAMGRRPDQPKLRAVAKGRATSLNTSQITRRKKIYLTSRWTDENANNRACPSPINPPNNESAM